MNTLGFGQLNQSSTLSSSLNSGLNSGINLGSAMGAGSYQHYGLNALGMLTLILYILTNIIKLCLIYIKSERNVFCSTSYMISKRVCVQRFTILFFIVKK